MRSCDPHDPCTSKSGAAKKKWARREAAEFLANYLWSTEGRLITCYLCHGCGGWHNATARNRQELRETYTRLEAAGLYVIPANSKLREDAEPTES